MAKRKHLQIKALLLIGVIIKEVPFNYSFSFSKLFAKLYEKCSIPLLSKYVFRDLHSKELELTSAIKINTESLCSRVHELELWEIKYTVGPAF